MKYEQMMSEELMDMDEYYGAGLGTVETRYDYIALCEVGELYRDIRRMRERERYYEALCA